MICPILTLKHVQTGNSHFNSLRILCHSRMNAPANATPRITLMCAVREERKRDQLSAITSLLAVQTDINEEKWEV
ncbi:hypothetical protein PT277_00260 [Acetobacteraceae bacterium ESL0709]|nr:hypothetical protein [Acetobacteraceae bacterium ESL0709]